MSKKNNDMDAINKSCVCLPLNIIEPKIIYKNEIGKIFGAICKIQTMTKFTCLIFIKRH